MRYLSFATQVATGALLHALRRASRCAGCCRAREAVGLLEADTTAGADGAHAAIGDWDGAAAEAPSRAPPRAPPVGIDVVSASVEEQTDVHESGYGHGGAPADDMADATADDEAP